ncbi:hypothetical protein N9W34_04580 [Rickettsiales bacterium]|nr:hypothetical protein [Rickettsiales bacterium]
MTLKNLKNIIFCGFIATMALPALAQEDYTEDSNDNAYDMAYDQCHEMAEEQSNDDNWQEILNNCMKKKGFEIHDDSSHEDEMGE